MPSDTFVLDLARKAGDDTTNAIRRACQHVDEPAYMAQIAIMAAGKAMGSATGFLCGGALEDGRTYTAEEVVDSLIALIKPMALAAAKEVLHADR